MGITLCLEKLHRFFLVKQFCKKKKIFSIFRCDGWYVKMDLEKFCRRNFPHQPQYWMCSPIRRKIFQTSSQTPGAIPADPASKCSQAGSEVLANRDYGSSDKQGISKLITYSIFYTALERWWRFLLPRWASAAQGFLRSARWAAGSWCRHAKLCRRFRRDRRWAADPAMRRLRSRFNRIYLFNREATG